MMKYSSCSMKKALIFSISASRRATNSAGEGGRPETALMMGFSSL